MIKVLYVFAGARKEKFHGTPGKDFPDTQLYGLNHLSESGIEAQFKEPHELMGGGLSKLLGFRFRHFFMYFATGGYDVVFGSALLYALFWKRLLAGRAKFVLFNISLVRLFKSNQGKPLKLYALKWLLRGADAIVNVSSFQEEYLARECPFLRGKMHTVRLGVDAWYYDPTLPRHEYYLAVGRDNGRDYKTLIEAARRLPERRFEIVCSERNLTGVGEIPENVTVHLDIPFAQVKRKLEEARALLLITHDDSYTEGADCSGQTVLLDAMAAGCPVIASKKAYLETGEYLADGVSGLLVDFYDAGGIVSNIQKLEEREVRERLASAARRLIEESLSTKHMAEGLARVFKEV